MLAALRKLGPACHEVGGRSTLPALARGGGGRREALQWRRLDGRTPLDVLCDGSAEDIELVVALAEELASSDPAPQGNSTCTQAGPTRDWSAGVRAAIENDEQLQLEMKRQDRKDRKAAAKAEARAKREAKAAARRG